MKMANFETQTKIPFCDKSILLENAGGDSKMPLEVNNLPEFEEIRTLKTKLGNLEDRYKKLLFENEQTNLDLEHEKHKVLQLERQLQFVKDNQTIFEKLKDTYITMKYNKAAGRKLVEIRDKSVQTWDGVLCRACLDTEKLRNQLEQLKHKYNDCLFVSKDEMEKMTGTIRNLKSCVHTEQQESHQKIHLSRDERRLIKSVSHQKQQKILMRRSRSSDNVNKKSKNRRRKCVISKSTINL